MRARTGRVLLTAMLLAGPMGAGPAPAQFFEPPSYFRAPPQPVRPSPQVYPAPGGGYYYVPQQPQPQPQPVPRQRRRAEPQGYSPGQPAPQAAPSYSLRRLFGLDDDDRRPPAREEKPRPKPRPAPAVVAKPVKPKIEPNAVVAVFGDALADSTALGIAEAFDDQPEVDVIRKTRGDGGLVRMDPADWTKLIQETADATPKLAAAVVMVGANDRQPIREGEVSHEPLSERWRALYRDRVDAVVRAFQDKGVPLIWISAPPVRSERLSTDLIAMNEIYRERVQRAGGTYVDIWPGFVDDDSRYVDRGPDIAGQNVRLRAEGGVNFTRAGSRKVAFFADAEIKRLLEAKRTGTAVANLPATPAPDAAAPAGPAVPPAPAGPADQAALPQGPPQPQGPAQPPGAGQAPAQAALPAAPAAPAVPEKPVAGPVVPLTRPETTPGGALLSSVPRLDASPAAAAQKTFRDGVAPAPRPGRADDFRWPKS